MTYYGNPATVLANILRARGEVLDEDAVAAAEAICNELVEFNPSVKIPTSRAEAEMMLLLSMNYLNSHHPGWDCKYPSCTENHDERCTRWLTGTCPGPTDAQQGPSRAG